MSMTIPTISTSDAHVDGFGDQGSRNTVGFFGQRRNGRKWAVFLELTAEGLHLVVTIGIDEDEGDSSDVSDFRYYSRRMQGEGSNSPILQGMGYMSSVADVLMCNQQLNHLDRILHRSWGMRRDV